MALTATPLPTIRDHRVRDFIAWADTLAPGELMSAFFTSPFRDLTPAELRTVGQWRDEQAAAAIADVERLTAEVVDAIVSNALNPQPDSAVPGAGPDREGT